MRRTAPLTLVLVCALGLVLTGCDSGSRSTSSGGSSGTLEERLAKGERAAMTEIVDMGSAGVPIILSLLGRDDQQVVAFAAMTTKKMGVHGNDTVGAMIQALGRFPNDNYIVQAVKMRSRRDAALPEVVKALQSGNVVLQEQAARLLNGGMAEIGEPAVDPLIAILEGGASDRVKMEVMGALASIGIPADERARPVFVKIQAQGGKIGKHAGVCIKRLDSAHAWKGARDARAAEAAAREGK